MPNFTHIQYSMHQLHNLFTFLIKLLESSAKIVFSLVKLQTKHSHYLFSYLITCQWSIDSFSCHLMPHFQFQNIYGTIHLSNAIFVRFDLCLSKSLKIRALSLCVCILTFHMLMTMWLICAHLFYHFSVPACPPARLLSCMVLLSRDIPK
jgi:hypothetical protein